MSDYDNIRPEVRARVNAIARGAPLPEADLRHGVGSEENCQACLDSGGSLEDALFGDSKHLRISSKNIIEKRKRQREKA